MVKAIMCGLFAACLTPARLIQAADSADYGVGFGLSLDYGYECDTDSRFMLMRLNLWNKAPPASISQTVPPSTLLKSKGVRHISK